MQNPFMARISHDVFISYSSKDKKIADIVCGSLEKQNIRVWMAPRSLSPGKPYGAEIVRGIVGAHTMVLIFSGNSFKSPAVRKEIERAISKGKILIPFCIEDIELDEEWEYYISSSHWLDAINDNIDVAIKKLIKVVQQNILTSQPKDTISNSPDRNTKSRPLWRILLPYISILFITSLTIGGIYLSKRNNGNDTKVKTSEQVEERTSYSEKQLDEFSFTDKRDKQKYRVVKIGTQIWMAENLNFNSGNGSWVYEDDVSNEKLYGRLYNWETAKKVSPSGWHLPSNDEWEELKRYLRTQGITKMKEGDALKSITGWNEFEGNFGGGNDEFGFSGLPGGYRNRDGRFEELGNKAYWWSSTAHVNNCIFYNKYGYMTFSFYDSTCAFSIRCVKDIQ